MGKERDATIALGVGTLKQYGAAQAVTADNWGGFFENHDAAECIHTNAQPSAASCDVSVVVDNWSGLFEEPTRIVEERVPIISALNTNQIRADIRRLSGSISDFLADNATHQPPIPAPASQLHGVADPPPEPGQMGTEVLQPRRLNRVLNFGSGAVPEEALHLSYVDDSRDWEAVSLVCRRRYGIDTLWRKYASVSFCYAVDPARLLGRFSWLESCPVPSPADPSLIPTTCVTLISKPDFSIFELASTIMPTTERPAPFTNSLPTKCSMQVHNSTSCSSMLLSLPIAPGSFLLAPMAALMAVAPLPASMTASTTGVYFSSNIIDPQGMAASRPLPVALVDVIGPVKPPLVSILLVPIKLVSASLDTGWVLDKVSHNQLWPPPVQCKIQCDAVHMGVCVPAVRQLRPCPWPSFTYTASVQCLIQSNGVHLRPTPWPSFIYNTVSRHLQRSLSLVPRPSVSLGFVWSIHCEFNFRCWKDYVELPENAVQVEWFDKMQAVGLYQSSLSSALFFSEACKLKQQWQVVNFLCSSWNFHSIRREYYKHRGCAHWIQFLKSTVLLPEISVPLDCMRPTYLLGSKAMQLLCGGWVPCFQWEVGREAIGKFLILGGFKFSQCSQYLFVISLKLIDFRLNYRWTEVTCSLYFSHGYGLGMRLSYLLRPFDNTYKSRWNEKVHWPYVTLPSLSLLQKQLWPLHTPSTSHSAHIQDPKCVRVIFFGQQCIIDVDLLAVLDGTYSVLFCLDVQYFCLSSEFNRTTMQRKCGGFSRQRQHGSLYDYGHTAILIDLVTSNLRFGQISHDFSGLSYTLSYPCCQHCITIRVTTIAAIVKETAHLVQHAFSYHGHTEHDHMIHHSWLIKLAIQWKCPILCKAAALPFSRRCLLLEQLLMFIMWQQQTKAHPPLRLETEKLHRVVHGKMQLLWSCSEQMQDHLELSEPCLLCHIPYAIYMFLSDSVAATGHVLFNNAKVIFRPQELLSIVVGFGLNKAILRSHQRLHVLASSMWIKITKLCCVHSYDRLQVLLQSVEGHGLTLLICWAIPLSEQKRCFVKANSHQLIPWDPGGYELLHHHRLGGKPKLKKGGMSGTICCWASWAVRRACPSLPGG